MDVNLLFTLSFDYTASSHLDATLGLSVSVVDVTLSDAYRARSDIATSQNLVFDLMVDRFKCPFTALFTQLRHNSASLYGRLYIPRSSSSTQTLQPNSDFAPEGGWGWSLECGE